MESPQLSTVPNGSHTSPGMQEEALPAFQYNALDSSIDTIRLVSLQPVAIGEDDTIVRCQLIHSTFLSKPAYDALSYQWGDPSLSKVIFLNDIEVPVRENLYWALYYLQNKTQRLLWVDAISINQNDFEERKSQVALMPFIYGRAQSVRVWLGQHPDKEKQQQRKGIYFRDNGGSNATASWICGLEYWRRLWIVQEVGLALKLRVHLGSTSEDWNTFIGITNFVPRKESHHLLKLHEKRLGRHKEASRLEDLLEDFQYACCSEPRDRIYGLLGLSHDCQDGSIQADYSKPLFELYKDVIRLFCRRRLLRNGSSNDVDRSMRVVRFSQLVNRVLGGACAFNSEGRRLPSDTIQARAAITSYIIQLGPTYSEMISSYDANQKWKLSLEGPYPRPQDIACLREANESYGLVLLRLEAPELAKLCAIKPQNMYSRAVKLDHTWNDNEDRWYHQELENQGVRDINDTPTTTNPPVKATEPRMFLGTNYRMGLVPSEAKEGDLICHFWGCNIVALLRYEENSEVYRIVGRVHLSTGKLDERFEPVRGPCNDPIKDAKVMHMQLDVRTLNVLTC